MRKVGGNFQRFVTFLILWTRYVGSFIPVRINVNQRQTWVPSKRIVPSLISFEIARDGSIDADAEQPAQGPYTSLVEQSFDRVSAHFRGLPLDDIQKSLVRNGVEYAKKQSDSEDSSAPEHLRSSSEKVPGCVANVHVRTFLQPTTEPEGENKSELGGGGTCADSYRVHVQGTADALLSAGLLAVLANALEGVSADQVLGLDPGKVAEQLGIRPALSPGRNDGVAAMVQVIQKQIQSLLVSTQDKDAPPPALTEGTQRVTSERLAPLQQQQVASQAVSDQPKVALLLSGGVDSSVALNMLTRQNYTVTAFYLKIWLEDELAHLGQCPWEDDYRVCEEVCKQAGVPLETISLQDAYKERVISYTVSEAKHGRTPNPDIMCNSRIKFGCFYEAIAARDFDFVATGHYAQLVNDTDAGRGMRLLRAPDPVKDQSYFLCALTQEQLQRVLFPIGHLQKTEVRALAEEFDLPNRHRPDSQGLCFLGKVKFEDFLGAYLGEQPGDIIDAATGDLLGRHKGVWYHTVGQRKGIGKVLFPLATSRGPWYVVAKDPDNDTVFCSNKYDEDIFTAARSSFTVENIQWTSGTPPVNGRVVMKIRHGPRLVEGALTLTDKSGTTGDVILDTKDGGLAPGQYVVFYEDQECLGGGVISERHWANFLLDREKNSIEFGLQQKAAA